jgi:hypothetical protein
VKPCYIFTSLSCFDNHVIKFSLDDNSIRKKLAKLIIVFIMLDQIGKADFSSHCEIHNTS